jgi:hypothetical protein
MLDKQAYMLAHACTHTYTHPATRRRAHLHKYIQFIAFPRQNFYANTPKSYVIRTVSVLLGFPTVWLKLSDDGGVLEFVVFYIQYI